MESPISKEDRVDFYLVEKKTFHIYDVKLFNLTAEHSGFVKRL